MMTLATTRRRPGTYARGEDTRRRILETALEIFAAQGYEGTSTRQLAERAGVNLPAIQYYFGSKEGLYRAVIGDIVEHTERHMAALTPKVSAAIDDPASSQEDLLGLLCAMLEAFVSLVTGGPQIESRRLFFARAEVEHTPGLDFLHENGMRQIFRPCLGLLSRLLGKSTEDPEMVFRTLTLIGQVVIFCNNGVRLVLKSPELDEASVRTIQALVRTQTQAIVDTALSEGKAA
jgi:TetR/AcrR family transcriptional regulator, regulator of cefoperazone and chloramphenicol sensitivity